MIVKQNGMTYDENDPRCQFFLGSTQALGGRCIVSHIKVAFITVVDDRTQMLKRYFGLFDWDTKEDSIRDIMNVGGKWPDAFKNKAKPQEGDLYE